MNVLTSPINRNEKRSSTMNTAPAATPHGVKRLLGRGRGIPGAFLSSWPNGRGNGHDLRVEYSRAIVVHPVSRANGPVDIRPNRGYRASSGKSPNAPTYPARQPEPAIQHTMRLRFAPSKSQARL